MSNISNEPEIVSRFLSTKNIVLPPTNEWLIGCIEWFRSQNDSYSVANLQKFALQQWLLADLRQINQGCLPPNLAAVHRIVLTGIYHMQINYFFNVGESAYNQYEKKRKLFLEDQAVGEEKQASWMPKARRMLKVELTDGTQTIEGFEYSPLNKLNESMEPGTKVIIKGPIECRKGILFMKDDNIDVLGGEVDTLCEENSTVQLLAKKLQLDPNTILGIQGPLADTNLGTLFSQENRGNKTNNGGRIAEPLIQPVDERNLLDSDDDDIFLNVPPESDTLNQNNRQSHSNYSQSHASDLNYSQSHATHSNYSRQTENSEWMEDDDIFIPPESDVIQENNVASHLNNSRQTEGGDWFEDDNIDMMPVDDIEEITSKRVTSNSYLVPDSKNNEIQHPKPVAVQTTSKSSCESSKTIAGNVTTVAQKTISIMQPSTSSAPSFSSYNEMAIEHSEKNSQENIETVYAKVKNFKTKLLFKEENWKLSVALLIDQKIVNASFDPDLLYKIIGFSPAEMMARQNELAVNLALKEKLDKMLKEAQLLIKDLACEMTLQKSPDSNLVTIISVNHPKVSNR